MTVLPSPGSPDARSRGCKCSTSDNANGVGAGLTKSGKTIWWTESACPLHGKDVPPSVRDDVTGDLFGDAT